MNILIKNTRILTLATEKPEIILGDLGIANGMIVFIGEPNASFTAKKIIDGSNALIMPGLINAHTHSSMSLMRNYADDLPFWPWLTEKIWPIEEHLTGEDCYWGAMLSIAEMIRSGITTFADMYFYMDDVAKAVDKTGIRANLSRGLVGGVDEDAKLKEAVEFKEKWHDSSNGRIRVELAPHAPYTCNAALMRRILEKSKVLDTRIHIHLSESKKEVEDSFRIHGKSPVQNLLEQKVFERPTFAVHCVHLSDEDIKILAENNVSVVNNPGSNMKLGNGFAPIQKLLEAGVNVALGTDGSSSNNNLNMFEEMNLAALVNKSIDADTTVVPAYTALKMGTINGAVALGIDQEVGTLEIGKKADLILIDLEKPHFYPRLNLVASLVYSAQASDVKTVICDGKILMENREILVFNEQEVFKKANDCAKRLITEIDSEV